MKKNAKLILLTAQVLKIVEAILIFVVGLTLLINRSFDKTISIILGIVLLLTGFATLISDLITEKSALTASASVNAGTIALGILCFVSIIPLESYLALLLIVLGSYIVLEAILTLIFKRGVVKAIIYLVIGGALLVLGILFLTNETAREVLCIIIGVILMLSALLLCLDAFLDLVHGLKAIDEVAKNVEEQQKVVDAEQEVRDAMVE